MSNGEEVPRGRSRRRAEGPARTPGPAALAPSVVAALCLWVIVGAGLGYGIWETVVKVSQLFN
jgi:hypothetical protein